MLVLHKKLPNVYETKWFKAELDGILTLHVYTPEASSIEVISRPEVRNSPFYDLSMVWTDQGTDNWTGGIFDLTGLGPYSQRLVALVFDTRSSCMVTESIKL